jgi:hypothetical protein
MIGECHLVGGGTEPLGNQVAPLLKPDDLEPNSYCGFRFPITAFTCQTDRLAGRLEVKVDLQSWHPIHPLSGAPFSQVPLNASCSRRCGGKDQKLVPRTRHTVEDEGQILTQPLLWL